MPGPDFSRVFRVIISRRFVLSGFELARTVINRQWNRIFTPLLYTQFQYHGSFNKLRSLWGFLRTLVESPRLAGYVQELWLTTSEMFEPFQPADTEEATRFITEYIPFSIPNDYVLDQPPADQRSRSHWARFRKATYGTALYYQHKEWITETLQCAINDRAWLEHHKGGRYIKALPGYYQRLSEGEQDCGYLEPLTALVIGHCPNLRRLSYDLLVHESEFFDRMLSCATGFHTSAWALHRRGDDKVPIRPLQKLEVLRIAGGSMSVDWNIQGTAKAHRVASLAAEHRNYSRLPRVRDLTVLNESAEAWYWNGPASPATRTRALERLTINGEYWPDIISIYAGNLRQLSLNLTSRLTGEAQAQGSLAWDEAWKMLRAFMDHLEYLDLYHSSATIMSSAPDLFDDSPLSEEDTEVTPFCPSLTEFTKLRQLNITPLGLAGYQCAHPAGCKFRNHLPPKLESIGIYTDPGDWAREHFSSLDKELEGIALEGSRNGGRLRAVVVCDSPHAGNIETVKLQAACTANGIFYSNDGSKYLFYCGNETVLGDLYHWVRGGDRERRFEDRDPGRVIPWGMEMNDIPGPLRGELRFGLWKDFRSQFTS